MSDFFYRVVRGMGRPILLGPARTLVLHEERARLPGGCLLVANHHSYFDAPVLVGTTTRLIDWLSIVELFQNPISHWFMSGINCMALDRSRKDTATTREIVRRLAAGRMVGLFPEAGLRQGGDSVLYGGDFASNVAGLAQLSRVPVIPVVVLGAGQFLRPSAWLPLARTFLVVNYGEPLFLPVGKNKVASRTWLEKSLRDAFHFLFHEIQACKEYQNHAIGPWWEKNYPADPLNTP